MITGKANKPSIKNWAIDDRPREKLLSKNPMALSDSELLALLINHGDRGRSAVDLAKEILKLGKDDLSLLGKLPVKELMKVKGIGLAKATIITAALELGRRRQAGGTPQKKIIKGSKDVVNYLQSILKDHSYEVFLVIFLNQANRVIHFETISTGGLTGTIADPRVILRKALEENATHLILCHNHPSGNLKPSASDQLLTAKIKEAAAYFDIRVLDHLIVSDEGYFSFADSGLI